MTTGRYKGCHQVNAQPGCPTTGSLEGWCESIFIFVETGPAHHGVICFFPDHINNVVYCNTAKQAIVLVNDRRGNQILPFEQLSYLVVLHVNGDSDEIRVHNLIDGLVAILGQQDWW